MATEVNPRTEKSCSNPVSLPVAESFRPSTTVVMYSPPFHAPKGRAIRVSVVAEMEDPNANPTLGTVGVSVHQCCDIVDEQLTQQSIGPIGPYGSPETTQQNVTLGDQCTLTTHFGTECVYYLRLKIASGSWAVRLSYSVQ